MYILLFILLLMLYDHSGLRQIMKLGAIAEEIRDYLHVNKFCH